jgi:hypothetical protein
MRKVVQNIIQNSVLTFLRAQWLLYVHQVEHLTILRSAHSVFTCFEWISEQTAIISLYGSN